MNPEQQNQPQSNPNIPDYLGMEPVGNPFAEKRKKNRIIVLIVAILVVIVVAFISAAIAMWYSAQNSPEQRLYDALDKHMQVKYIKAHHVINSDDDSFDVTVSMDASDVKQTKSDIIQIEKKKKGQSLQTRFLVDNNKQYMIMALSDTKGTFLEFLDKNQWYETSFHAAGRDRVTYFMGDAGSPLVLNSVQGLIPTGNFTDEQRDIILTYIIQKNVYEITNEKKAREGSDKLTGYEIAFDPSRINGLNTKIAEELGLKQKFMLSDAVPTYHSLYFWINDETKKFAKITYSAGESEKDLSTEKTIQYEYPKSINIESPDSVKDLP